MYKLQCITTSGLEAEIFIVTAHATSTSNTMCNSSVIDQIQHSIFSNFLQSVVVIISLHVAHLPAQNGWM